jgi:hypothetical protein
MPDFTKLAAYLDSFDPGDVNYDIACFIKSKIAQDFSDPRTINNADDEELGDNDVTMATPDQQAESNTEGALMSGAFREFDALNKLQKEKEEVQLSDKKVDTRHSSLQSAGSEDFPGMGQTHNQVSKVGQISLFTALQTRLKQ